MPTPSTSQTPTNYNYVSSLDLVNGLHMPEIDSKITARYGNQNLTGFFEMMGAKKAISAIEYSHYEDDWLHQEIKVAGQSAGSANAAVTHTMDATMAKTFPGSAQSPYIVAGNATAIPVRPNDIVQYPNGVQATVTAVDTTVSPPTFTVYPNVLGESIPAVTTSTEIIVIGNTWGERTGQPGSRETNVNLYQNNLMIYKDKSSVSGTEMAVKTWVQVAGPDGKLGWVWYLKSWKDELNRSQNECELLMLLGQKLTNTTLGAILPTSTVTEGLIPFVENLGNTQSYSLGLGWGMADLEASVLTLDRERGSMENAMWCGRPLSMAIDNAMGNRLQNGGISYGAFDGSEKKAIDFGFQSFTHGGYTFHKKVYDLFNYKKLLGATGHPYPNAAIIMPLDTVKDAKTKESVPSCRINYLSTDGYSREHREWLTGAEHGTETDELNVNRLYHKGFEGFAPNRFIWVTGA